MPRKKKEPNIKAFLFDIIIVVALVILAYLALMHSAWVSEHIMKPIFAPIFKDFGTMPK